MSIPMNAQHIIKESTADFLQTVSEVRQQRKIDVTAKSLEQPWSILDILEHLLIVEEWRVGLIEKMLLEESIVTTPSSNQNIKKNFTQDDFWNKSSSREIKAQSPDYALPKGNLVSIDVFEDKFKTNRKKMEHLLLTFSEQKLEHTFLEHGRMGMMNAKEWMIYLAGHGEKHRQQILEWIND